jgi:hypothetical protein
MRSSEYFRAQARLYLDLADLIGNRQERAAALASAADNLQRAEEMEAMEHESEVRSRT